MLLTALGVGVALPLGTVQPLTNSISAAQLPVAALLCLAERDVLASCPGQSRAGHGGVAQPLASSSPFPVCQGGAAGEKWLHTLPPCLTISMPSGPALLWRVPNSLHPLAQAGIQRGGNENQHWESVGVFQGPMPSAISARMTPQGVLLMLLLPLGLCHHLKAFPVPLLAKRVCTPHRSLGSSLSCLASWRKLCGQGREQPRTDLRKGWRHSGVEHLRLGHILGCSAASSTDSGQLE